MAHGAKPKDAFSNHILGATGELALCKALGLYWSGSIGAGAPDADRYEIRTSWGEDPSLVIRTADLIHRRSRPYVLISTANWITWHLQGWIFCHEAPDLGELQARGGREPAWFVPPEKLHPIETLDEQK